MKRRALRLTIELILAVSIGVLVAGLLSLLGDVIEKFTHNASGAPISTLESEVTTSSTGLSRKELSENSELVSHDKKNTALYSTTMSDAGNSWTLDFVTRGVKLNDGSAAYEPLTWKSPNVVWSMGFYTNNQCDAVKLLVIELSSHKNISLTTCVAALFTGEWNNIRVVNTQESDGVTTSVTVNQHESSLGKFSVTPMGGVRQFTVFSQSAQRIKSCAIRHISVRDNESL